MINTNAQLPIHVRDALPEAAQTRFRLVATEVTGPPDYAKAWSDIKKNWVKGKDGKYVRKPEEEAEECEEMEKTLPPDDDFTVVKVDKSLGLVFGWAIICKKDGKDYYDLNIDKNGERVPEHIPEASMLESAADFMENSRLAKEMHGGNGQGTFVFAFPLTTDIAKAMGIVTKHTGLMVAMKPNPEMLAKFLSGELTGFSIGGSRVKSREVEHA